MVKILSFDCESDGLYGRIFAVGGCLLHESGYIDTFYSRMEYTPKEPWVQQNVLPVLDPPTCEDWTTLKRDFWQWFQRCRQGADIWVDGGFPIETHFMRGCVDLFTVGHDKMKASPYPLNEVMTLFLARGLDPMIKRADFLNTSEFLEHHPTDDAVVSAKCVTTLLRSSHAAH